MIKACVFDIDGTLLDTLDNLSNCVSEAMEHFGYARISRDDTRYFVGDGYQKLVERALIKSGDTNRMHFEEACKVYRDIFQKKCLYKVKAYDGIKDALNALKEHGILMGVLSNKPQRGASECMDLVFGENYFSRVLGESEGSPRKPDPTMLLKMLREFGVRKEEVMYFGDTNTDMQTGKSAGVITVGVSWGFREIEELQSFSPEHIIHHPREIVDLVLGNRI